MELLAFPTPLKFNACAGNLNEVSSRCPQLTMLGVNLPNKKAILEPKAVRRSLQTIISKPIDFKHNGVTLGHIDRAAIKDNRILLWGEISHVPNGLHLKKLGCSLLLGSCSVRDINLPTISINNILEFKGIGIGPKKEMAWDGTWFQIHGALYERKEQIKQESTIVTQVNKELIDNPTDNVLYIDGEFTTDPSSMELLIQIGIVEVNPNTFEFVREALFYIKPEGKYKVGDCCTKLTGIKKAHVEKHGISFKDLYSKLSELGFDNLSNMNTFCWGKDDSKVIRKTCLELGVDNMFKFNDLASLYKQLIGTKNTIGLMTALSQLNLSPIGLHHNALDDAKNAAQVHMKVLKVLRDGKDLKKQALTINRKIGTEV